MRPGYRREVALAEQMNSEQAIGSEVMAGMRVPWAASIGGILGTGRVLKFAAKISNDDISDRYGDRSSSLPVGAAIPKKTRRARLSRTISSSARQPT